MKGIKKSLMASLIASTTFTAYASPQPEVSPWSYTVKAGLNITPFAMHGDDAKINGKPVTHSLFDNPFVFGGVYVGYAFTNYVGMGAGVYYIRTGATLKGEKEGANSVKENSDKKTDTKELSIGIHSHTIAVPLFVTFYLMPYNEKSENGTVSVDLGANCSYALSSTYSQNDEKLPNLSNDQKKQGPAFNVGLFGNIEYAHSSGLSAGLQSNFDFMNQLNIEKGTKQGLFKDVELTTIKPINVGLTLGYNFATLLSE